MAAQAERICVACGKLVELPQQNAAERSDTFCSTCLSIRRQTRRDERHDDVFDVPRDVDRRDYDLHAPGVG